MGIALAKYFIDDTSKQDLDIITVIFNDDVYLLENTLHIPCETPLVLIYSKENNPKIILTHDANDRVVFSLRGNMLHFIILKGDTNEGKRESTSYPWLSNLDGIRISRLTEEEYKETKVFNLMEFRD